MVIYYLFLLLLYDYSLFAYGLILTVLKFFIDLAIVTHTHLELTVDFEQKILKGKAILDIEYKHIATELVSKNFL